MSTPETNGAGTFPGTEPPASPGQQSSDGFFRWIRNQHIVRSGNDRWIGGAASGVARRLGIDPLIVRGVLFVSIFLGGLGLVAYALAWALLPEEHDGRIHAEELIRGRFDPAIIGAGLMLLTGIFRPDNWGFGPWKWFTAVLWIIAIVVVTVLIVKGFNESRRSMPTQPQPPTPGGQPPSSPVPEAELWAEGTAGPDPAPAQKPIPVPDPVQDPFASTPSMLGVNSIDETIKFTNPTAGGGPAFPSPPPPNDPLNPPPTFGSGRGNMGNVPPFVPTQPYVPQPIPAKARVEGPGKNWSGIVVALCFFAVAGLILADRLGYLPISLVAAILGTCVVILGLGIVVTGLRGRRSGVLGTLAILTFIVGIPAATFHSSFPESLVIGSNDVWKPTSAADAANGRSTGLGNLTVDLTEMPTTGKTIEIPIESSVGNVKIIVPRDVEVTIQTNVSVGRIKSDLDWASANGNRNDKSERLYYTGDAAPKNPKLAVDAKLSVGNLTIEEKP